MNNPQDDRHGVGQDVAHLRNDRRRVCPSPEGEREQPEPDDQDGGHDAADQPLGVIDGERDPLL